MKLQGHIFSYRTFCAQLIKGYECIAEQCKVPADCWDLTNQKSHRFLETERCLFLDFFQSMLFYCYGLHDPDYFLVLTALEFFKKDRVLTGQTVSQRKVIISCCFFSLPLTLDGLLVAFYVFGEEIFSTDFIEISEVVDSLFWKEANFIECLGNILFLAPVNVPIIIFSLSVLSAEHCFLDAIGEVSLEFDIVAA